MLSEIAHPPERKKGKLKCGGEHLTVNQYKLHRKDGCLAQRQVFKKLLLLQITTLVGEKPSID
jgi:hypothetical protein